MATNFFISQGTFPHRAFVDVGSKNGDCGFRAIAAAIIDNVLTRRRLNQPLLVAILEQHSKYFNLPQAAGLLTPIERLLQLIDRPSAMSKFLTEFAYTLRQIAVDKISNNPERYRGAFIDDDGDISATAQQMRQPNTWIDETAIAALAEALNISITVNFVDGEKKLALKTEYGPRSQLNQPEGIIIQVEKKHYKPYLRNINRFQALPADTNPLQPKEYEVMDPPLETILERINAEDQRLIQDFEKNKVWLENLINDNEISVDELIDVYIEGMKHSDYLEGRINSKYIGIEHGYENFFSAIKNAQHQKQKGLVKDTTQTYNFESSVTQGLIHALARAISIGQLNADSISDSLERAPHKSMLNQG